LPRLQAQDAIVRSGDLVPLTIQEKEEKNMLTEIPTNFKLTMLIKTQQSHGLDPVLKIDLFKRSIMLST
jgi:hypothetical protein